MLLLLLHDMKHSSESSPHFLYVLEASSRSRSTGWFPILACCSKMSKSSSSDHPPFLTQGSRWCHQRSRHCFVVRFEICDATSPHLSFPFKHQQADARDRPPPDPSALSSILVGEPSSSAGDTARGFASPPSTRCPSSASRRGSPPRGAATRLLASSTDEAFSAREPSPCLPYRPTP